MAAPGRRSCHGNGGGRKGHLVSISLCQESISWSRELRTFWCLASTCVWYLGSRFQTGFLLGSSGIVPGEQKEYNEKIIFSIKVPIIFPNPI